MSKVNSFHELPIPASSIRGSNHNDRGDLKPSNVAWRYRPRGVPPEPQVATISRFAGRLIDRQTGEAYSAEELIAAITALVQPTSTEATPTYAVSASITISFTSNTLEGALLEITDGTTVETFTITATPSGSFDIQLGVDEDATAANAETAINAVSNLVSASAGTASVLLTALVAGVIGNDIGVATSGDMTGAGNLIQGEDANPTARRGSIVFDDDNLYIAKLEITASSTTGWELVSTSAL